MKRSLSFYRCDVFADAPNRTASTAARTINAHNLTATRDPLIADNPAAAQFITFGDELRVLPCKAFYGLQTPGFQHIEDEPDLATIERQFIQFGDDYLLGEKAVDPVQADTGEAPCWQGTAFYNTLGKVRGCVRRDSGSGCVADSVIVLYRIVQPNPPTQADMLSYQALGIAPETNDAEVLRLAAGISLYNTFQQAHNQMRRLPPGRRGLIAELHIPADAPFVVERTGR